MAVERTLILCKGDAVVRGLVGEILARYERRGYTFVALKLMNVVPETAQQHYAEHQGKPFFNGLVEYITRTPVVALVVEGEGAVEGCRATNGATNPIKANPGTVRGDYGQTVARNLVHASDSPESANREIALWFTPDELIGQPNPLQSWLSE